MDAELINLAYDYSDGVVSEWIGSYLDNHPDTSSKTLLNEITAQYGKFINPADAARALIKVTQGKTMNHLQSEWIDVKSCEDGL